MPVELTEEVEEEGPPISECTVPVVWDADRDWYLDHTEDQWLTATQIHERFPRYRSAFGTDVSHDRFGLRTARRRVWAKPSGNGRRYKAYLYPRWRVQAWVDGESESVTLGGERDETEQQWLTAQQVQEEFGFDRTTFQHAVSRDRAGLCTARRQTTVNGSRPRREQVYQYPLWRIELWADVPAPTRPVPSRDEVKRLRSQLDVAASLLAREVGFSTVEVRAAAQIGDLDAGLDPNTNTVLFLPPQSTDRWLHRDSWKHVG
jgi:hypothetical protein